MKNHPIDIVLPWVDGNDPEWQKVKKQHSPSENADDDVIRYRDFENLKYIFRGIEKYMPWVRTVHFVTWGHLPDFLNCDHPQLNIVKHEDFIPKEYLPTFSSHTIELNLHRIEDLSEHFIYFNDDTFVIDHLSSEAFFKNGQPSDQALFDYITSDKGRIFPHILLNNVDVLNRSFNKQEVLKEHPGKWLSFQYGLKANLKNIYFSLLKNFTGFKWFHVPSPLMKKTYEELWEKHFDVLDQTSKNKFREMSDVNQYLLRNWQLVSGDFHPINLEKMTRFYYLPNDEEAFHEDSLQKRYALICVNDSQDIQDFQASKKRINQRFEEIFPHKSKFER